ncbi:MAG: hypothetical protein IIU04_06380 [Bacteroidales bacterium]|nr:hypothetical protein [Bacteroidales bacterium]
MKTVKMYEYGKSTFNGWESWWSLNKPDEVCGNDFIEHTDTAEFEVPEGFHIGTDMVGDAHFYPVSGNAPAEIGTKVGSDGNTEPYLYGMTNLPTMKRIYLKKK